MRITVRDIQKMKDDREPIVMLTAYDATSARLSEAAGVPMLLVGDSLGMVIQGHEVPIPVTLDHIIYHVSIEQALTNAGRLMQESGVSAIKMEGGESLAETISRVVDAGIPVMAHIGLMPQSVYKVGGMRVQGRDLDSAQHLLRDAHAVQAAGAFAVVLESVPAQLAEMITEQLHIPTIGIGAGIHCSGQVQVFHDIVGLFDDFVPRHTKQYAQLGVQMREAISAYVHDVQARSFPTAENSFSMKDDVLTALRADGTGDE